MLWHSFVTSGFDIVIKPYYINTFEEQRHNYFSRAKEHALWKAMQIEIKLYYTDLYSTKLSLKQKWSNLFFMKTEHGAPS